jgi:hypothetical protein
LLKTNRKPQDERNRAATSFDPLLIVRAVAFLLMLLLLSQTEADPDLWGHVLFGRDIVVTRSLPETDRYSFTSDRPWINHEWLSESTMFGAYALLGSAGLSILKFGIVLAVMALVLLTLRPHQIPSAPHDFLVFLTIAGVAPLAKHMRPEMFSLLFFALLLIALARRSERQKWPFLTVPLLLAIWTNFHGGWLVGMGSLSAWMAAKWIEPGVDGKDRLYATLVAVVAALATLINPYGYRMWTFLNTTVGLQRTDIKEWLPVYDLGPGMVVLWCILTAVAVIVLVVSHPRPKLRSSVVVLTLAFASFRVSRLIGFYAISLPILFAPHLTTAWEFVRRTREHERTQRPTALATTVVVLCGIVIFAPGVWKMFGNLGRVYMQEDWLPEPTIARFVADSDLKGRMLIWFDWGEYAIWHFNPSIKVSIDGRRETIYSDAVLRKHLAFFFALPEGRHYASELSPDYIWLPVRLPIVSILRDEGWRPIFEGPTSVILGRLEAPHRSAPDSASGVRSFPGP